MKIPFYQADAFTGSVFGGNPAGVCLLKKWPDSGLLQSIAMENNLSETAFLVPAGEGFELRWFTPVVEVALCGHATLASAHVLYARRRWKAPSIRFETCYSGALTVSRKKQMIEMDFPSLPAVKEKAGSALVKAIGAVPGETWLSQEDWMFVYDSQETIAALAPDMEGIKKETGRGLIATAPGRDCDFVSRFFAPKVGIPEDPVTGSAHCVLVPYWSERLGKSGLHAKQISRRGGELFLKDRGDRVTIGGRAAVYLEGTIEI